MSSLWAGTARRISTTRRISTSRLSQGKCVSHGADVFFSRSLTSSLMGLLEEGRGDCLPASSSPQTWEWKVSAKGDAFSFFLWPYHRACGVLGPRSGIRPPALEAQRFHRWTTRKVHQLREGSVQLSLPACSRDSGEWVSRQAVCNPCDVCPPCVVSGEKVSPVVSGVD